MCRAILEFWDFLLQKITFEANLAGLVCGALARAGKWMARAQSIQILWAQAVCFRPGPMVVIVPKRKNLYVFFFAFQAILNTFYFWVKNLEKKYSKSQEDTPPPITGKIFYTYTSCFVPL